MTISQQYADEIIRQISELEDENEELREKVNKQEGWATWFGRRCGEAIVLVAYYYTLKWLGVIVVLQVTHQ